jgi:hypothetical protein
VANGLEQGTNVVMVVVMVEVAKIVEVIVLGFSVVEAEVVGLPVVVIEEEDIGFVVVAVPLFDAVLDIFVLELEEELMVVLKLVDVDDEL